MTVPGAGGQVRVPGAGANVRLPAAGANVTVPGASGQVRAPGAGANVNVPGSGANLTVPGASADVRTALRPNLDAAVRGGAQIDGSATAKLPGGVRIDPSVAAQSNLRHTAQWYAANRDQSQLAQIRTNLAGAMRGNIAAATDANIAANANTAASVNMSNWLNLNPQRATYWSNWGNTARSSFIYGGSPFFNNNWWNARSLIGIGLGGYGYGGGFGGGYGGWWGYQPWLGYRPWWYWYGNPGWNTFGGLYGWNQPYYYDYGPGGNVVYSGNQVLVNSQPVGTVTEYAQTAAELAAVDPAKIGQTKPEDWMPLGTFTLATAQDERDPARVIQLAINKEGLVSGTSFNKQTGKTYTVQGRVDKDNQRVAFTIGNATDIVMETGLFNLTQQETPVLAHLGPSRTTTYLLARLPEPEHSNEQATTTATATEAVLP